METAQGVRKAVVASNRHAGPCLA
uniref:Uncharacterized protein n=1 Tax=Rhizophora mucronata TaxID=61149 RepID=A0A2P2NUJ3_RHIMU